MSLILAIDQGTHASRALVVEATGRILASGAVDIGLARPQPGWAEQDAEEVVASVFGAVSRALEGLGARKHEIACAGLSSQRASCVCWDRASGRALSPIFSWQDRRAHAWVASLEAAHGDWVHRNTGLFLSPHYGASKLRWALDHLPAVRAARESGSLAWGPMASFLAFRLSKERTFAAEPQCAARTQLYNLRTRDWDTELLALFGLPAGFLPASAPTIHDWGTLEAAGIAVPITAVNGDQSAAVFAFGWPEEDCAYVNIGTSAFVQRALARDPGHVPRQLTGIILAERDATVWMVEGNVNGAGTALEWLEKEQGIAQATSHLPDWLARAGTPPLFLNGIAGLGGPFWKADFVSRFVGEGEPWQKAVAVVESIAFLLQANSEHIAQYLGAPRRIRVSGGVSRLDGLCRRLAAVTGVPVHRREDPEASARGIAYLAAGRPASWNTAAREEVFDPQPDAALQGRYRRWRDLMQEATGVRYL
ncbi:MAG TPA: FGGY family carbohydrate kinase [Burkholderiales bacterium]